MRTWTSTIQWKCNKSHSAMWIFSIYTKKKKETSEIHFNICLTQHIQNIILTCHQYFQNTSKILYILYIFCIKILCIQCVFYTEHTPQVSIATCQQASLRWSLIFGSSNCMGMGSAWSLSNLITPSPSAATLSPPTPEGSAGSPYSRWADRTASGLMKHCIGL
jgi:hypothetical protein